MGWQVFYVAEVQVFVVAGELAKMIEVKLRMALFIVEPHNEAWKLYNNEDLPTRVG